MLMDLELSFWINHPYITKLMCMINKHLFSERTGAFKETRIKTYMEIYKVQMMALWWCVFFGGERLDKKSERDENCKTLQTTQDN